MIRLLKILAGILVCVALVVLVLYLAIPANETPKEGAADPILYLRRPVLTWLRDAGIVERGFFLWADPWLPSAAGSHGSHTPGGREEAKSSYRQTRSYEPVFRGLFWPVGDRLTCRLVLRGPQEEEVAGLRLWYEVDGSRVVPESQVASHGRLEGDGRWFEVRGYVPRKAQTHGVERVRKDGLRLGSWSVTRK